MRIALFSDIHGNTTGLKAVLAHIDKLGGVDMTVCAGDMIGGGSGTDEVFDLLLDRQAQMIIGNWDEIGLNLEASLKHIEPKMQPYIRATHDWLHANMSEPYWAMLRKLPRVRTLSLPAHGEMFICHASPDNLWDRNCSADVSPEKLQTTYGYLSQDLVVYGHFHHHHIIQMGTKHLINVASIGLRSDGLSNWTMIESTRKRLLMRQYQVRYDIEEERRLNYEMKLPEYSPVN